MHLWRKRQNREYARSYEVAYSESLDSGEVADAERPLMTRTKIDTYDRWYARRYRFAERGEFEKAIRILQKILEDYPNIADVYSLIAISYMGLKRSNNALIYFEKATTAAAGEWSRWCNLANLHLTHRRISKAVDCLHVIDRLGYPHARNLAMLYEVRENASKDHRYLKELEDCMQEGYF